MALTPVSTQLVRTLQHDTSSNAPPPLNHKYVTRLYNMLTKANTHINKQDIKLSITTLRSKKDIPMSRMTLYPQVTHHIRQHSSHVVQVKYNQITIYFITESAPSEPKYKEYARRMLLWLHVAYSISRNECAKQLMVFVYHTSLRKELPVATNILTPWNVNTAFTQTCMPSSEIVIYRKEEWFKVFIHETFHALGFDFSEMNDHVSSTRMNRLFSVSLSNVRLYEAYTECWARILNASIASFIRHPTTVTLFSSQLQTYLQVEKVFAMQQSNKVLAFTTNKWYNVFMESTSRSYAEKTSALSYYVITMILMVHLDSFLDWCDSHNTHWIDFKQTNKAILSFCTFIETAALNISNTKMNRSKTLRFTAVELA